MLCKNIDVHKLAPRKSQYLITAEDRGQSVMLKCALNVRDLALAFLWNLIMQAIIFQSPNSYKNTNRIVMGNNKDSFFIRNKDSIVIGLITTFIGVLFGYLLATIDK